METIRDLIQFAKVTNSKITISPDGEISCLMPSVVSVKDIKIEIGISVAETPSKEVRVNNRVF